MSDMSIYTINGSDFWYRDGEQPSCAIKKEKAKGKVTNKAVKPANKKPATVKE